MRLANPTGIADIVKSAQLSKTGARPTGMSNNCIQFPALQGGGLFFSRPVGCWYLCLFCPKAQ
jgi:hypothetical protein